MNDRELPGGVLGRSGKGGREPGAAREHAPTGVALFAALPGIRGCCVGDLEGLPVDRHGESERARAMLLCSAALARALVALGSQLGLGVPGLVTTKGAKATLLTAYLADCTVAVDLEPNRPLKDVESALLETAWQVPHEWVVSDREIDYLPDQPRDPEPPVSRPPPRKSVGKDGRAAQLPPESSPATPRSAPSARDVSESAATEPGRRAPSVIEQCAALRRALIKGRLAYATQIAADLRQTPSPADHPFGSGDSENALRPLLNAIANILAGDNKAGLAQLEVVREASQIGPSLKWVAQIWSARASTSIGGNLDAASVYAESSLRLATGLDDEARAVSTLLLAEIRSNAGEPNRSLKLSFAARNLFADSGDSREIAACWLLEARVLSSLNRQKESLAAAENARACHPSWPAPVTFIVRHALGLGRLDAADLALATLLSHEPIPPEAERDRRLIEYVRLGDLPLATACLYLDLLEAPPGAKALQALQEIAAGFPEVFPFQETLGWKLLRAGEAPAARTVFARLNANDELPDDMRSSVLLGLGCLVSTEKDSAPSSVKLRAVVNAAPEHSVVEQPVVRVAVSSPQPRKTDPMDLKVRGGLFTPNPTKPHIERPVRRAMPIGPSFSGTLQLFGVPDVLEILRAGQKTGTLVCSSAAGIGAVHLRSGKVTGAVAPSSRSLRDHLLACNAVTEDQLRMIDRMPDNAQDPCLIDVVLLEQGFVTPDQVREALRQQVVEAFAELVEWREGQFAFDPELVVTPTPSLVEVDLDPQNVLLEMYTKMATHGTAASH